MPWVWAPRTSNGYGRDRVGGALQREQSDLRAVAVADHKLVAVRERVQGGRCGHDVTSLDLGVRALTAGQQRVTADGGHHAHGVPPRWRP
jgi:hypothetical protein